MDFCATRFNDVFDLVTGRLIPGENDSFVYNGGQWIESREYGVLCTDNFWPPDGRRFKFSVTEVESVLIKFVQIHSNERNLYRSLLTSGKSSQHGSS